MKILLCGLIFFSQLALADNYWVEPVKAIGGAGEADAATIHELITSAVTQGGKNHLASTKTSANFILGSRIMKLGDAYVLVMQKKTQTDDVVFSDKMKAMTMSEMDSVASRLTQGVINNTSADSTADVTNITSEEENRNTRRYKATRQWILGIGPGWTSNLKSSGGGFSFLLGYLWGLDPDWAIKLSWTINSGHKNDNASYSDLSLGGEYYFSRGKHTPFLGARLGYASASTDDHCDTGFFTGGTCDVQHATGWGTTLSGGYRLFRTSTVNAGVSLNYSYLFDRTTYGNPSLMTLLLAVYY